MTDIPSPPVTRPAMSALIVATLTFSLLKPHRARQAAMLIAIAGVMLLTWFALGTDVPRLGLVQDVMPDGFDILAAVHPPLGSPFALRIPAEEAQGIAQGDLVIAFGAPDGRLFVADYIGVAPVPDFIHSLRPEIESVLVRASEAGIAAIAILSVIFAPLVLRALSGLLVGTIAGGLVFVGLQFAQYHQHVVLPAATLDAVIMASAYAGAAIGFKATFKDKAMVWQRLSAVAFAFMAMESVRAFGLLPDTLLPALPLAGAIFPSAPIIVLATLAVGHHVGLSVLETGLVLAALFALRMVTSWLTRNGPEPVRAGRLPTADANGQVRLKDLVQGGE